MLYWGMTSVLKTAGLQSNEQSASLSVQVLILTEVPDPVAESLSISAGREPVHKCRLLASDCMLFGFDSTSEPSYQRAYTLLVALSDATRNAVPVALLGLRADLGTSSSIQRRVRSCQCIA